MTSDLEAQVGVNNLVRYCISVEKGESVLLLNERGGVDADLVGLMESAITATGGLPYSLWVDPVGSIKELPAPIANAVLSTDKLLLNCNLNRVVLLDHLRVNDRADLVRINNRIRTAQAMASEHARFDWRLVMALAQKIEERAKAASTYRVTSPYGTDISGRVASASEVSDAFFLQDAELSRTERVFPGEVYAPIGSSDAKGVIAFDHPGMADRELFLHPMLLSVQDNTLQGIEWREEPTRPAQKDDPTGNTVWTMEQLQHLLDVNEEAFGREASYTIDSFHGGFHPKAIKRPGQQSNQNVMHFHVGRIPAALSAYISDQSIELDGELFWDKGQSTLLLEQDIRVLAGEYGEVI